jgi:arginyl-tRNA synthetase
LTKALALLSVKAPEYVIFEFVSLPTGSLSTRAGRYISADELMDNSEIELIKMLSKFEYIVEGASLDLKPHRIAKYARELAEYFGWGIAHDKKQKFGVNSSFKSVTIGFLWY